MACGSIVEADLIRLDNGGEIRGTIEKKESVVTSDTVTIVTLSGVSVAVERQHIQFVTRRPHLVELYETRAKRTLNTLEAQWELAEWCRQQGATLKKQREVLLQRVLELDPEHQKAHDALKHTKRNGIWMTRDEERRSQGYVKYKGRYITPQELELIEKTEAELDAERRWYRKVHVWRGWLTGRYSQKREEGLAELQKIDDPHAVPALRHKFSDDKNAKFRQLYVSILSQIPGDKPVPALVSQSLRDSDYEIRYSALNGLSPQQHDRAMLIFARELKNGYNSIVRRAGRGLERVGDERVVFNLIDALVTTHRYRIRVPAHDRTMSFRTNGSFGNTSGVVLPPEIEVMLRTGQLPNGVIVQGSAVNRPQPTKVIRVKHSHKNAEVLAALQKVTKADFGYDGRSWRLWWTAKKNGTIQDPVLQ